MGNKERIIFALIIFVISRWLGYRDGFNNGMAFKPAEVQEIREYCKKLYIPKEPNDTP